jgi:hypothetical protein
LHVIISNLAIIPKLPIFCKSEIIPSSCVKYPSPRGNERLKRKVASEASAKFLTVRSDKTGREKELGATPKSGARFCEITGGR